MSCAAFYISIALRYGDLNIATFIPANILLQIFGLILITHAISFKVFGLYKGIWRFSSVPDLIRVSKATSLAVLFLVISIFFLTRLDAIPRSSFFIFGLVQLILLGGGRFAVRAWKDGKQIKSLALNAKRVLIVGAGEAGIRLAREIKSTPTSNLQVVGFADDDTSKSNRTILGIPILGELETLPQLVEALNIDLVIIAIPSATAKQMKEITKACIASNTKFKTLPKFDDLIGDRIDLSLVRNVKPEDLLSRQAINLDARSLGEMIKGKVALITGGGGSIGAELCFQLANFAPKQIIIFEQSEYFLYKIEQRINQSYPRLSCIPIIGDVKNAAKVEEVLSQYKPDLVFHAAAYKHVPLMEVNATACVKNNVVGTYNMATLSSKHNIEKFVLVSTDKAVNPTNIMGATKRIAEILCQNTQTNSSNKTQFITVRFGNVLGSNGSVVPLFKKQIEKGGPVTVTHPEITRFFMSIPEACQLVLQAATMGNGGEIFVLDMGKPVRIVDLAREMIFLAGLKPDSDIKIKYIGLRPGEKLYEELLANEETSLPTPHKKVRVAKSRQVANNFQEHLTKLIESSNNKSIRSAIQLIVPEFTEPSAMSEREKDLLH